MNTLLASDNTRLSLSRVLAAIIIFYTHTFVHGADDMYYRHNNMTCIQCHPGTHWVEDCKSDGGSALCKPCPEGSFIAIYNLAWSCQKCRSSCRNTNHVETEAQREEVAHSCTSTSDLLCRCRDGLWREPGINGACRTVTSCGLGSGVLTIASENSDTVCKGCFLGETFSNSTSTSEPCRPCSTCGVDETIQRSCTRTDDTVCAAKNANLEKLYFVIGVGIPVFLFACGIACCCAFRVYRRSRHSDAKRTPNHRNGTAQGNGMHGDASELERLDSDIAVQVIVNEPESTDNMTQETSSGHAHSICGRNPSVDELAVHPFDTDEASNPKLFMQKVYTGLSAEMDGNYQSFFRRNNIGENTISVIETEERRVRERCYRLFLVWGSRQTDVLTFQSNEIPLELIRRLRNMFQDDLDLMCAQNCLDVLAHYEQTWAQFNSRR